MYLIDRAVAIIKPRQPYLDWANSLPDPTPVTLEQLRRDSTAILIPESEYQTDAKAYIRKTYAPIFEMELDAWCRDESFWPATRNYETFTDWFDVEIYDMVIDASEKEITKEAY
ncbi:MAG: hypothetical protein HY023_17210 [Chloroflexi bacterium]|nr:hypothetical protein [Chloroflexota bacterium]